jgi:hypothetical protein
MAESLIKKWVRRTVRSERKNAAGIRRDCPGSTFAAPARVASVDGPFRLT